MSNALFQLVWKPLQPLLTEVRTVYYSPSGLLCRLSFAAIHADNGKLLTDKYNLKQLLCTRSLAWSSQNKDFFTTASLWGDIDYDNAATITAAPLPGYVSGGTVLFAPSYDFNATNKSNYNRVWQALPGTKTETEKIFLLLKEKNIIAEQQNGSAASEEQFKKMDGASPGLLHIATHGFFLQAAAASKASGYHPEESNSFSLQQNPMFRSGLLLAGSNATWSGNATQHTREDGVLTAYEISQLDLSNSQLITLSACETALGDIEDNEGVYGLQRAFKMAGAQRLLMSLWKVPDKETSELMLIFYTYLLQGDDASNALHNTQLAMKEKYAPYYWAGFVLTE